MKRPTVFDNKSKFLDRFGLLLIVTVASIIILMLVDIGPRVTVIALRWESALATLLVGSALLLALRASGLRNLYQRIADVIVVLVVLVVLFLAVFATITSHVPAPTRAMPPLVVLLAVAAPLAVVRRLAQHREVTRATVLGAVSGYLLIPIAAFYLFLTWSSISDIPFFGDAKPTTTYMYFSLTTVTTTGYGDITAQTDVGRLLAMGEALTGQIYLVVFVALVVGLYASGMHRRRRQKDRASAS
jgi:hypothetical protein